MEGGGGCAAPPTKNVLHATRAERGETGTRGGGGKEHQHCYLRDLSCLLRCSLLEKARLQNWHLYFFSGSDDFLICDDDAVGRTFMAAAGMFFWGGILGSGLDACWVWLVLSCPVFPQSDGGIVWCASVGVGFKVRLGFVVVWCSFVVDFLSSMGVVV